ncbi:MAG: SocA family protein [bacterium]|nr:SocA family protein [bacterium]
MKFIDLLLNILDSLDKQHFLTGKTRLIKIAYLVELEYFRRNRECLTDANWIYYLYGPYPDKYSEYFSNQNILLEDIDFNLTKVSLNNNAEVAKVPQDLKRLIQAIIEKYGQMDLNELLNYIYYDTEPMINVQSRGEPLDFSTVLPEEHYKIKEFKNIDSAKEKIKKEYKEKIKNASEI